MSIGAVDGLLSGISTSNIVAKMMASQRARVRSLEDDKQKAQQRSDAIRDIRGRLSSLESAISRLQQSATFAGRSVTTNTPPNQNPVVSASAGANAATGSFTIRIDRLATASIARSTSVAGAAVNAGVALNTSNIAIPVTSGTFTINGVQFTVDAGADSLNDVIADINAQSGTTGVTATLVADADGRAANRLQLSSAGTIKLGSAGDSSNFLSAMKVLGVPQSGGTITGQGAIGGVKTNELLGNAGTATAITGSGAFKINNVEISYNASVDTVNDVIARINASQAGVTASYDTINDRLVVQNVSTGDLNITFEEVSGNFLTAFKLTGAGDPVTLGQTAKYSLDGGATWRYSISNTVSDAVPNVNLTLLQTSATDTTVTVSANTDAALGAVKGFLDALNNAIDFIKTKTSPKNAAGKPEILAGDSSIRAIADHLRSLATGKAQNLTGGYVSLQDVGVSTGAVGSAVGTTNKFVLDETKFRAALAKNPNAVAELFVATSQVALTTAGDVSKVSGTPLKKVSGTYSITSDGLGTLSGTFTPTGGAAEPLTGNGAITAGGTNTTLIPGLTLTGANPMSGATTTITVTARAGIATSILDYVKSLNQAGGTLQQRQDSLAAQQRQTNDRIRLLNDRLARREEQLYQQFQRLEMAMARAQEQSSTLSAGLSSLF
jgi:flagellar hook-associated protein 2